jgi:hypothetical protein
MLKKVTFVAHMIVDTDRMSIIGAKRNVKQALLDGDGGEVDYGLHFKRLLKLEIMEEEA